MFYRMWNPSRVLMDFIPCHCTSSSSHKGSEYFLRVIDPSQKVYRSEEQQKMHCWRLILVHQNLENCWKLQLHILRSCIPTIYTVYTVIYISKDVQEAWFETWVDGSKVRCWKRIFQLSKVEKQADIQPVYTDIQKRYTLNRCKNMNGSRRAKIRTSWRSKVLEEGVLEDFFLFIY